MRVEKTQAMGFNNTHIVMGIPREIQDSEKSFISESSFHTVCLGTPMYKIASFQEA